jgi:hypothetical protein
VTTISAIVLAPDPRLARAAIDSVVSQQGQDVELIVIVPGAAALDADPELAAKAHVVRLPADSSPAAVRNAGVQVARGPYFVVIEPPDVLVGKDVLARHVAALEADKTAVAIYGRTEVVENGTTRVRPERGRGGWILRRLVQHKGLIASSASVVWRRSMLRAAPFEESYRTPGGLLLSLLVSASKDHPFLFLPDAVARTDKRADDLSVTEEQVKVFVALLYGATRLEERLEARVRFRLARHLVALGKHHYRKGDHARAGRLFGEAVKAVPSYFKGRRYQFMNFLKGVISRP